MLVYILQNDEYFTFHLPKKIEGSYVLHDYDNDGFKRTLVNVVAIDSKWIMKSNESFRILFNNQFIDSIELNPYNFYTIVSSEGENLVLYVAPGNDLSYVTKRYLGSNPLVVGSNSACDIIFALQGIPDKLFELKFENGLWSVKRLDKSVLIYINGRVEENKILSNFDSIFVNGLVIVVCSDRLFINNPFSCIHFLTQSLGDVQDEYIVSDVDTTDKSYLDFYDSSDYFLKSPIFIKRFKTLEITITGPDEKEKPNDSSLIMSIVPSALMSITTVLSAYFSVKNYNQGKADKESLTTTIVMCLVMLFIAIVWPFVERFAERIKLFINEITRNIQYKRYLKKKNAILDKARNEQKTTLQFNNLSLFECQEVIRKKNSNLFSSSPEQQNFLTVRLGVGKVKMDCAIDYMKPDFIKTRDNLLNLVDKLIDEYKYIDDAPYTFCLKKSIAFIQGNGEYDDYLDSIILQLITFNDYYNLKLVVFTNEHSSLNKIRNLNHCWDNDREMRFFATDIHDAETLSSYLIRIYNSRIEKNDKNDKEINLPYYIIICDDIDRFRNLKIIDKVLHQKDTNLGFSFVAFSLKISDVPDGCSYFVDYNSNEATLFESEMSEDNIMKFKPELINNKINFNECVKMVANIPIKNNNEVSGVLPEKVGFLEMYNVGRVEQLRSVNRWKTSQITNTLAAPIGIDVNGNLLSLDLHEKNHGPHGLIAGMTGSGKSEFIITYILSLAVNYSPEEVQFVLIDYKGGGLAGAFENRKTGIKLPHLVGTITNLDKSSMNRTLVSIKSELQRRQRVFNEAKEQLNSGTIDIYKYQKLVREGAIKDPMAHLFIICDEFAELKAQQPEFMDELVSAARIGRSLGIHLILATQKPSGVVDDQIWSNSKFKVCCKVQTADDSKEMIRRDDAAFIKESGRFFLQVGYDEIFVKGQSAYTGTQYVPSDTVKIANKGKDAIEFLDHLGNVVYSVKKENNISTTTTADLGDELGNVLKYLIACANEIGFKNKQLWLDNIPNKIYIYDLFKKYPVQSKKFVINPLVGEYDDPHNQKQGPVSLNITEKGNLWISGVYGGGKTTLLSTIIYSSIVNYGCDELNIYIVDLLAESLRIFSNAPQVGDFVSTSEPTKLNKLFHFLTKEVVTRKKHYSNTGGTFVSDALKGNCPFPNILVVLNGMDILIEQYDSLYNDIFMPLVRDCNRVGIYFVITSTGSLNVAVENCFSQKIAMRYLDSSDYTMLFNDTRGIIPASNPGRGLVELDCVYEFQAALIFPDNSFEYNLNYVLTQLNKTLKKASSIPTMPRIVGYDNLKNDIVSLDLVPIGIELSSNCVYAYDFTRLINLVIYSNVKMASLFVSGLIRVLSDLNNIKIIVLDVLEITNPVESVQVFTANFKKICMALSKNIEEKKSTDDSAEKIIFIISGYNKINSHLKKLREEDETVKTIDDLIMQSINAVNFKFIVVNDLQTKMIDNAEWSDYLDPGNGILLSTEFDQQELIDAEESYDDVKIGKDVAVAVNDSKKSYIKFVRNRGNL